MRALLAQTIVRAMRTRLVFAFALLGACSTNVGAPPDAGFEPAADARVDAFTPLPDARPLADASPPQDVEVVITADNGYGFGYGTESEILSYFGGVESFLAGEIFNCSEGPESYTVPAADASAGNALYIIAWADKATTQGVIAQFQRAGGDTPTYTGSGDWEVCPTGQDYDPGSGGPTIDVIGDAITACNDESAWVDGDGDQSGKLQIGEDNSTPRSSVTAGNEFPIACGIDEEARWMWYSWDPSMDWPSSGSPFIWPGGSENIDQQFLIFRLSADVIVE